MGTSRGAVAQTAPGLWLGCGSDLFLEGLRGLCLFAEGHLASGDASDPVNTDG